MMNNNRKSINLLELTPAQRFPWEMNDRGNVEVLVPKFRNRLAKKWIQPYLRQPHMRVKLDAKGSFVWKQCDGKTTVAIIAHRMEDEFGDTMEEAHDRIRTFLLMLEQSDLIHLEYR